MIKNELGTKQIFPLILCLAIPTMLAQFINVLYSIVDRMFIGHITGIGNAALAGVGVCSPIISVLYSFAFLVGQGGTPLMAMELGAGNHKKAEEILANCFKILIFLGIILTIIFLILRKKFLWWFGASQSTFPYALEFLTIYMFGTIFALISGGMNSFLIAQGRSLLGVGTVLVGTILNITLDPILIFNLHLGVAGAAISTIFSQFVSSFFAIYCLKHADLSVRLVKRRFNWRICKRVLVLGLAPFLTYALDSGLLILLNATLQRTGGPGEGDILVTCATIIQSYMLLITSPLSGITLGCQGVVSYNLGAKNYPRVKKALWCIYLVCLSFCGLMLIVTLFGTEFFAKLFTSDPTLLKRSVLYIKIYSAGILCMAAQWTVTDMGTAMGQMKMALTCSLVRKGIYVLGVVSLPLLFQADTTFFAQPICDVVASVISIIIFQKVISKLLRTQDTNNIEFY